MNKKYLTLIEVGEFRRIAQSGNIDRIERLSRQLTGFVHTHSIHITPRKVIWMGREMRKWPSNKRLHIDDVIQCLKGGRLYTLKNNFYRSGREEECAIMMMGHLYEAAMDYVSWKCHDATLVNYASDYLLGWQWSGQIERTPLVMANDAIVYAKWVRKQMKKMGFCR